MKVMGRLPSYVSIEDTYANGADWEFGIDVRGPERRAKRVAALVAGFAFTTGTGYEFVETMEDVAFDRYGDEFLVTDDIYVVYGKVKGGAADTDAAYDRLYDALAAVL